MPTVTKNLIIINVLLFFGGIALQGRGIDLSDYLGLHFFLSDHFNLAQLITYMFMHGGWTHIFFNMFALWMFGSTLERVWGPKRFLTYYLVCGIGAGLIQEVVGYIHYLSVSGALSPEMISIVKNEGLSLWKQNMNYTHSGMGALNAILNVPTVGASGSIYGILLAFGMLFPNQQMFIFPLPVPIKAKFFVIGYAALELYLGFANNVGDNVAHFAHLGGMLFGFFLIIYWRKKNTNHHGTYYH